jgi:krueppel-like factor 5
LQTSELDAYLCKQELERLQRLEEAAAAAEAAELEMKPRRESASQIDEFFEAPGLPHHPQRHHHHHHHHHLHHHTNSMSYVSMRTVAGTQAEDDVFLKPALWEDITSSIQKLDPENAEMLAAVKQEVPDETASCGSPSSLPLMNPPVVKIEKLPPPQPPPPSLQPMHLTAQASQQYPAQQSYSNGNMPHPAFPMSRLVYLPPPTPPISEPGSPGSNLPRRTPPPPYPTPNHHGAAPTSASPTVTTAPAVPKYNRRNNPELEKRRIHHCDFQGEFCRFAACFSR